MRYHVLHIHTAFAEEWQKDLFDDRLAQLGVDTIDAEDYYIPSDKWLANSREFINLFEAHPEEVRFEGAESCPDQNWNAAWEAEHPALHLPLDITIVPHCAFGAGHHATTSMLIDQLMNTELRGKCVFDHGTGTGVLAIFAKRLGAAQVVAVDIDEHSVTNARENAALNNVDIDVRLGDTICLPDAHSSMELKETYHLILANIHRNILLANMPRYAEALLPNGQLWLSGFYAEDCQPLIDAAACHGLHLLATNSSNGWFLLQFHK